MGRSIANLSSESLKSIWGVSKFWRVSGESQEYLESSKFLKSQWNSTSFENLEFEKFVNLYRYSLLTVLKSLYIDFLKEILKYLNGFWSN